MLVLIQHPHDWTIEPIVGEVWGRANLRINGALAVSSAHFQIVSVDGECVCIRHIGKANGFVVVSPKEEDEGVVVEPGSEISLRVNDKYFFMDAWRRIYFRVDDQEDLDASSTDDDDDVEEVDTTSTTTTNTAAAASTAVLEAKEEEKTLDGEENDDDDDDDWIEPDDDTTTTTTTGCYHHHHDVTKAAGAVVRAIFSRVKKQQQPPPLLSSSSTSTLVKSSHIPKLRRMMAAKLKSVTSDQHHDSVDKVCKFGVSSGFHSSTRIHNDIIPAPVASELRKKKKKRKTTTTTTTVVDAPPPHLAP